MTVRIRESEVVRGDGDNNVVVPTAGGLDKQPDDSKLTVKI